MTGLFVDTFDLYRRVKRKFNGKIAYDVFAENIEELYAYGMSSENNEGFVTCLRALGFKTRFKRPRILQGTKLCDWGVGMAMDVVKLVENRDIDTIIFATCNLQILPLVRWLKSLEIKVIIWGVDVPKPLSTLADSMVELNQEDHLEETNETG